MSSTNRDETITDHAAGAAVVQGAVQLPTAPVSEALAPTIGETR